METEIVKGSYNISVDKNYIATIGQIDGNIQTTVSGNERRDWWRKKITVTSRYFSCICNCANRSETANRTMVLWI